MLVVRIKNAWANVGALFIADAIVIIDGRGSQNAGCADLDVYASDMVAYICEKIFVIVQCSNHLHHKLRFLAIMMAPV
jgi:hypothetical protein